MLFRSLVRVICQQCKEEYTPSDLEMNVLGQDADEISKVQLYRGKGCDACSKTGYMGRLGIFEIFVMNEQVQDMIYHTATSEELRKQARKFGMRTLREDGLRKVISGITTLQEVLSRTTGEQ